MKILLDTNIILDLLLAREPFVEQAQILFGLVESGQLGGYIGATTVTTLDYLLSKAHDVKEANKIIKKLLKLFEIAPINRLILEDAIDSGFADFEDAVLHAAAIHCGIQAIATRDEKGFAKAKLAVYTPNELLHALSIESIEIK